MIRFWITFAASVAGMALILLLGACLLRPVIHWIVGNFLRRLMSDTYAENLLEMLPAFLRMKPHLVFENSLRAHSGKVIERPFGSPRRFPHFDQLVFSPAQVHHFPTELDTAIDVTLTIGPRARRPLRIDIPLLLGGMGFGVGVSAKLRHALALGASQAGTAINSGHGPLLPEERSLAKHLIVQYHTAYWARFPEALQKADAVEIRFGQGALAGVGVTLPAQEIAGAARELMRLPEGVDGVIPSRHPELLVPEDLPKLVRHLREITSGVPIGVKMSAGKYLERDLERAVSAGVDFISIDGGQAGTKAAPPILQDDFGLPTIYALCRAVRFLENNKLKDRVTLLVGGSFFTPGDCLKAIALGADGVYLGTAALWAMTHTQVAKAVPWEPPTQLVYYGGKLEHRFDEQQAAAHLYQFLVSTVEEMKVGIRALGKTSLREIGSDDLLALDEWTAYITGVSPGYPQGDDKASPPLS
ncbi:FMN-binding glutamate synthase family protein [Brevibacillus marinus]|uniref:FMN-binding glutamate synthase family protein n=1 Tax=Brevibacillus marinus TaxID=2496837 RepID=UPI001F493627|nr:FMN-binding glutamate synthase family protein [Brevibacillus marinus]